MNKPRFETPNLTAENVAKIAELFPGVVAEGKVNFGLLRSMLGEDVFGDEAYEFTWVGKRAAIAEAGRPIRKTLRPCVEESKNWDTTENLYIEGDNLDVLKLLQESYLGKVKMIYIDPPYNTGNDFIYRDDFSQSREDYDEEVGMYDEDGDRMFHNTETNGRFHSDWCSMIYPRLVFARNILCSDGVIFISIGEEEIASLIHICNEIFGDKNCVSKITRVAKTASNMGSHFAPSIDFILCYAKDIVSLKSFKGDVDKSLYKKIETEGIKKGELYRDDVALFQSSLTLERSRNARYYICCPDGSRCIPPVDKRWRVVEETVQEMVNNNLLVFKLTKTSPLYDENGKKSKWNIYTKSYLSDREESGTLPRNIFSDFINRKGADLLKTFDISFDFAKPVELVAYLCKIINWDSGIFLDFFSGSATTAHAVMQLNAEDDGKRKFIMVQLPETCADGTEAAKAGYKNICEIGKERIRRAGEKIKAEAGLIAQNLDIGFRVLKLDDTNMNDVYYAPGEYTQDMIAQMESNIKPDRTDMDLLFGCLLDWGLPLSMPHTHEKIDGFTVHTYNSGDLIACFEEHISEKAIREIAGRKPLRVVFRDSSFTSSPEKINVFEIFKMLSNNTSVKVI